MNGFGWWSHVVYNASSCGDWVEGKKRFIRRLIWRALAAFVSLSLILIGVSFLLWSLGAKDSWGLLIILLLVPLVGLLQYDAAYHWIRNPTVVRNTGILVGGRFHRFEDIQSVQIGAHYAVVYVQNRKRKHRGISIPMDLLPEFSAFLEALPSDLPILHKHRRWQKR